MKRILRDYNDRSGQYGFHSKSTGIGGIITWRQEGNPAVNDNKNHAIITTLFPIKKIHTFKNVTAQIIVESQMVLWAKEKGMKREKRYSGICQILSESHENCLDDFYLPFFENRMYDLCLSGYILVP